MGSWFHRASGQGICSPHGWKGTQQAGNAAPEPQGLWVAPGASPAPVPEPQRGFHTHSPPFFRGKVLPIISLSLPP